MDSRHFPDAPPGSVVLGEPNEFIGDVEAEQVQPSTLVFHSESHRRRVLLAAVNQQECALFLNEDSP